MVSINEIIESNTDLYNNMEEEYGVDDGGDIKYLFP